MANTRSGRVTGMPSGWDQVRRWDGRIVLVAILLVAVSVTVVTGWAGWLVSHPEEAWWWIVKHLPASTAGLVIAGLGVWVAWAVPRAQQRRTEAREDERQARVDTERAQAQARQAAERQAAWERRCQALLVYWPLPRVADADPYQLGVFYSRRADAYRTGQSRPPYVARAMDNKLAELLRSQSLVLIKGQSRAGKSRTAFEVASRELGGWRLLAPTNRSALATLAEIDPPPGQNEQLVVWLDDLEQYVAAEGARGLDAGLLTRWAISSSTIKVVATIRLEEYGRLMDSPGEIGRRVRELLNRFDPGTMILPVTFDEAAEQAAIAELYPGETVSGGLGEFLAAAHELIDRLEIGEASVPEGAAMVFAAVDWQRAGLDRPISKAELAALIPIYLEQLRPLLPLREGDADRGLGWATEPVGRTAALLVPDPDALAGTFRVAEPIVDHLVASFEGRGRAETVPAAAEGWDRGLGLHRNTVADELPIRPFLHSEWCWVLERTPGETRVRLDPQSCRTRARPPAVQRRRWRHRQRCSQPPVPEVRVDGRPRRGLRPPPPLPPTSPWEPDAQGPGLATEIGGGPTWASQPMGVGSFRRAGGERLRELGGLSGRSLSRPFSLAGYCPFAARRGDRSGRGLDGSDQ